MKKKLILFSGIATAALLATLTSCGSDGASSSTSAISTASSSSTTTTTVHVEEKADKQNYERRTIYVSPNGNDSVIGTDKNEPTTFSYAMANALPGDTLLLSGGSYCYNDRVQVPMSGDEYAYITVKPATENDRVIFDFSGEAFDGAARGIQIYGDYWHFQNIEITGAGDNGMYIAGSYNIIENCLFYNNRDTGLQIGRGYSNETTIDQWPSYNLIKNCTSFANYDAPTFGENADGFAAKLTVGYGNTFDGCIAFRNSDDGWDLFAKVDSGDIGTVVLYNCLSFENGYLPYEISKEDGSGEKTYNTLNGDGIGFKLGGSTMEGNVIVENSTSWDNKLHGIGDNSNPGVISVKNFTAFNNCSGIEMVEDENGTITKDGKKYRYTGNISSVRGIFTDQNKSNNIDLARSNASYNNYYGILSYVNDQANYSTANDSSYNKDAYKGSAAYSVFQTTYKSGLGEIYSVFKGYEDASSYASDTVDTQFSSGEDNTGYVTDADFKNLASFNMTCADDSQASFDSLIARAKQLRNADGSINTGDHLALADNSKFKTFANGNAIGSTTNKSSWNDYTHYYMHDWSTNEDAYTDNQVAVKSASSVCVPIADVDAVYQDFKLPKYIQGCDITWTSSDESVVTIDRDETYTVSNAVFSWARVTVPDSDKKVTLTAIISMNTSSVVKTIEITVKGRSQSLGDLVSSNSSSIRVDLYGHYAAPEVYAVDGSAITICPLPSNLYTISYSYRYAKNGNATFYDVDGVYTSIPGVFEVTAKATWKADESITRTLKFNVYVVDPDCDIDFLTGTDSVALSNSGFVVNGELSNIEGDVVAITSPSELTLTTASQIVAMEGHQEFPITANTVAAQFTADNSSEVSGSTQYYIYYAVVNKNKSNAATAKVYSTSVSVVNVTTKDEFYSLARTGKIGTASASATTIYSLTTDLDFTGYEWKVGTTPVSFSGLFKGNNYTISNITASGDDKAAKTVNIFAKVEGGTVMDVKFTDISLTADKSAGKQVGIIGELQGGFVYNVHATRVKATGKESIGGIIGQITGGNNYVELCSLVNPSVETTSYDDFAKAHKDDISVFEMLSSWESSIYTELVEKNEYPIAAVNKYAGGIIGNGQKNSDQTTFTLTIKNCYVNAIIGDGGDAGGNTGLIIGRVKNDMTLYRTEIDTCVAYGTVISHGQYNSGIVGDFDNGVGYVSIHGCLSMVQFIYNGLYLNAMQVQKDDAEAAKYAHKNSNPIVGRAVKADDGIYETAHNLGSFGEYYSTYVSSMSFYFDLCSFADEGGFKKVTKVFIETYTEIKDSTAENNSVWSITEETETSDATVILKCLK